MYLCRRLVLAAVHCPPGSNALDSGSDWRVIDAADELKPATSAATHDDRIPRWLIGAITAVVVAGVGLAIWATLPSGGASVDAAGGGNGLAPRGVVDVVASARTASGAPPGTIVVDVEGAVTAPGLHVLNADGRVGDAIAAAGGYAPTADIDAAGRSLNLAAKLTDGQQVRVPALGDAVVAPPTSATAGAHPGGSSGGLIDINQATADELDTLPGIGPVTAAKIIDARAQAPFASVDELQSRGVVGASTFEKLRDLITVTP